MFIIQAINIYAGYATYKVPVIVIEINLKNMK